MLISQLVTLLVPRVDALHVWSNLIFIILWGMSYYPSFTGEKTKAQKRLSHF